MSTLSIAVAIGTLLLLAFVWLFRELKPLSIISFIVGGLLVAIVLSSVQNLRLGPIVVNLGEGKSVVFNLQTLVQTTVQKADQTSKDLDEVKALKTQIAALTQEVQQSERNVSDMKKKIEFTMSMMPR